MFKFKGISSKEMDVCVTEINNLIRKAPQRYEEIYIDGRDGAFFHPLGYSPIEVPLELTLMKPERIDEVLQWLNGTGWLEYNGRKTKAHIFSEVEPIRASTIRIIQVTIIRNPFWEKVEDDWEEAWGANLIKNGWDDFEPYGNEGEKQLAPMEVFEEGYAKNHFSYSNFKNKDWFDGINVYRYKKLDNIGNKITIRTDLFEGKEKLDGLYVAVSNHPNPNRTENRSVFISDGNFSKEAVVLEFDKSDDIYLSYYPRDYNVEYITNYKVAIYSDNTGVNYEKYFLNWGDFPEEDLIVPAWDNMAVLKTSLGNGLTRIRTWGGNHRLKLILKQGIGARYTFTTYLKTEDFVEFMMSDGYSESFSNYNGTISLSDNYRLFAVARVFANASIDNLDFIASDPVIVEGNKAPNWQATSDPAIYNEGTAVSKPLIKLEKGKDRQCEFEVNGTYFKFHFNDDDHVILDCEEMEATYNGFNRNRHLTIGFEWPKLKPKENFVKRISGDAKILFKRKDRWL